MNLIPPESWVLKLDPLVGIIGFSSPPQRAKAMLRRGNVQVGPGQGCRVAYGALCRRFSLSIRSLPVTVGRTARQLGRVREPSMNLACREYAAVRVGLRLSRLTRRFIVGSAVWAHERMRWSLLASLCLGCC